MAPASFSIDFRSYICCIEFRNRYPPEDNKQASGIRDMRIEEALGDQRRVGELLFLILHELGSTPEFDTTSNWYKVRRDSRPIFLWFRFVKETARKYPPCSIHLVAKQSEEMADARFKKGNNFFGPDFNVITCPDAPKDVALAIEFLCKAFQVSCRAQAA